MTAIGKRLEMTAWIFVKSVIDTTPNPFLILNPKLRVILANKHFYRFFRVTPQQTENQLIYNLGQGQWDIAELKKLLEEILPLKNYFKNFEVEYNFPKIGSKIMLLNGRQVYEQAGLPRFIFTPMILLVMEDITALRETQRKAVIADKMVEEARIALEQQKEIDKLKSEFVSLASHQLRTPLTSMKWYADMLLKKRAGELTPKQKKYVKEIYHGNERMIDLVRNLLNVSRIEAGILAVNPKPADVGALLEEVTNEQVPFYLEKKHEVVVEIPAGLPKISTDSELVRMIFRNLFGNAVVYTPPRGKIICTAEKKGNEIVVRIRDTGIGIPAKQQRQVFKKFFRGDNATRESPQGTGLELFITKAMVEALEGKIWFQSKKGKGTTFWVALPLRGSKNCPGQKIVNNYYGRTK